MSMDRILEEYPLRASCGCHYRLQQEYDTRDGGYKRVVVDPTRWNRCTRHAEYPHYRFAAAEIASAA